MKQKQPELAQEYLQQMLDFGCEPDEAAATWFHEL